MIVSKGEKVHVVYRALYENSTRRHFLGEVVQSEGAICRIEGYVFVFDKKSEIYIRKNEKRITIIDLAESGHVTNIIDSEVDINNVKYKYVKDQGMIVTDEKTFSLNINEFSAKS